MVIALHCPLQQGVLKPQTTKVRFLDILSCTTVLYHYVICTLLVYYIVPLCTICCVYRQCLLPWLQEELLAGVQQRPARDRGGARVSDPSHAQAPLPPSQVNNGKF